VLLCHPRKRKSPRQPKPPLMIPGTDFLLYGAAVLGAGFLVLVSTGAWLLLRKLRKTTVGTAKKRRAALRKQLKRLYKEARKIQKCIPAAETTTGTSRNSAEGNPGFTGEVKEDTKRAVENWYASVDRCLREYIQALCTDTASVVPAKDEAYFLSATYTELTKTLTEVFASKQEITDLFCIFYAMLERQRFGSSVADLICNYTAVSQDMLKQLPHIAERTETEYALH